jgi:predicted methyltransferase
MTSRAATFLALAACAAAPVAGPAAPPLPPPAAARAAAPLDPAALVAAPDRTEGDRALDAGRHPAELLAFLGILPGMRVAELSAADGYTAELLARAVGPAGTVYAQNSRTMLQLLGADWARRLARPAMQRAVRVDRELEDPLPPEARGLDLVVLFAGYHDLLWLDVDRARLNRAVFEALRPGGAFVVVDSSAVPGAGREAAYDLHRVDEALVRREVEAAGFRLAGQAGFLRNPADTRDWSAAPNEAGERRGTSDRFVLRFVRP